jgi:drug/metabolite transporter (DMT)-like permease
MSLAVLALVLVAAFAHAGWNLLAKGAEGGTGFVWLTSLASAALFLPVAVVAALASDERIGLTALGLMAGSGALHALYFVLLQRGYATGDLSLVYPLARGTGPLLSGAAAIAFLGERPSALALAGAAIIVLAVLSLARGGSREAAVFALLTGTAIAGYTLWDKQAVGDEALDPIVYYWGTNACNALLVTPLALRRREGLRLAWRTSRRAALGVGALSPLAYILVLYALARAPVSIVAPARETSILIGTILGATVLGEGDTRRRVLVAGAILLGVVALALG